MPIYDPIDLSGTIEAVIGSGSYEGPLFWLAVSSGFSIASNPPYSATDFFTQFPSFGGTPTVITGTLDGTTNVITDVSSTAGLLVGQYVSGIGIPSGTTISNVSGSTVTVSQNTTVAGSPIQLTVYTSPIIPTAVLNAYIALASGSLSYQAWGQTWMIGMGLYIAHFLTLWAQSQGGGASTAAQVAAQGLAIGIKTSKSVGDVSVGSTPLTFEGFGAFGLTGYGQQFATLAAVIGSSSLLIY